MSQCTAPGRVRHRFREDGSCNYCSLKRSTPPKEPAAAQKQVAKNRNKITGPEISLNMLSDLADKYHAARENLLSYINKRQKEQIELVDFLEAIVSSHLNVLYADLGREVAWRNKNGPSSVLDERGEGFVPAGPGIRSNELRTDSSGVAEDSSDEATS